MIHIIGISGQSGSGKGFFSHNLINYFNTPLKPICMDWFFKEPRQELLEVPEAIDHELFIKEILKIKNNFEKKIFDNKIITSSGIVEIPVNNFKFDQDIYIIIEGFLLFYWKDIVKLCHIKYYIDVPYEICRDRRYFRDQKYLICDKKNFDNWYENIVYKYFLIHEKIQKEHLKNEYILIENK